MILGIGNHTGKGGELWGKETYPANHPLAPTALTYQVPRAWHVSTHSANVLPEVPTSDSAVSGAIDNNFTFTNGNGVAAT